MRDAVEALKLIDALRERGATMVEVDGIKAVFGPPPAKRVALEPAAVREKAERKTQARSLDARLLHPLGIGKPQ